MLETLVWLQLEVLLASRVKARDAAKQPTVHRAAHTAKNYPALKVNSAEGRTPVPHPCFGNGWAEVLSFRGRIVHRGHVRNPFGSGTTHWGETKGSSQATQDSRESG